MKRALGTLGLGLILALFMALPAGAIESENIFNSLVVELVGEVKYGWNVQADKCYYGKIAANGPGLSVIVKSKGLYGPDCLVTLSLGGGVQAKYRIGQTYGVLKGASSTCATWKVPRWTTSWCSPLLV